MQEEENNLLQTLIGEFRFLIYFSGLDALNNLLPYIFFSQMPLNHPIFHSDSMLVYELSHKMIVWYLHEITFLLESDGNFFFFNL